MRGRLGEVKALLAHGAAVDSVDESGRTPLMNAANFDHVDVGKALLAAGALVNHKAHAGGTPLHRACVNGRAKMASLLLAAGADPEAKDNGGYRPIEGARDWKLNDWKECVAILTEWRERPSPRSPRMPFHALLEQHSHSVIGPSRSGRKYRVR